MQLIGSYRRGSCASFIFFLPNPILLQSYQRLGLIHTAPFSNAPQGHLRNLSRTPEVTLENEKNKLFCKRDTLIQEKRERLEKHQKDYFKERIPCRLNGKTDRDREPLFSGTHAWLCEQQRAILILLLFNMSIQYSQPVSFIRFFPQLTSLSLFLYWSRLVPLYQHWLISFLSRVQQDLSTDF
jgi:hypothetical protein